MRTIQSPLLWAEDPPTKEHFHIDRALLREPNLWVPGKKPVGFVRIEDAPPTLVAFSILNQVSSGNLIGGAKPPLNNESSVYQNNTWQVASGEELAVTDKLSLSDYPVTIVATMTIPPGTLSATYNMITISSSLSGLNRIAGWYDVVNTRFRMAVGTRTANWTRTITEGKPYQVIFTFRSFDIWYVTVHAVDGTESYYSGDLLAGQTESFPSSALNELAINSQWYDTVKYKYDGASVQDVMVFNAYENADILNRRRDYSWLETDPYKFLVPA